MNTIVNAGTPTTINRSIYTNKHGSIIGRSYTNGSYTTHRDTKGNILGYSKDTFNGTKILDSHGSYKGFIANGLIRDSKSNVIGTVKPSKK